MKYANFPKISPRETREKYVLIFFVGFFDVINFRDDYARMRINDPLTSFARRWEENRVYLTSP